MYTTYSDFAPILILITLVISLVLGRNIPRERLQEVDGIFAMLGFLFGLFMTLMNLIYTSKELFLLSAVIAISCIIYLRYCKAFKISSSDLLLQIGTRDHLILRIIWWFLISVALLVWYFSEIYTRHPLFFFLISSAVALLGIQIFGSKHLSKVTISISIIKILLLSLILRWSAYYISPYPIGSDPWAHQEYISYFVDFGQVMVPPDFIEYYIHYPIAHLCGTCTVLVGSLSPHDAVFLLGVILTLSTVVTFLLVRMLTKNVQLALISMLILNFADVSILWSIQVIAMSFAIAIYAFIIFCILKISYELRNKNRYFVLLIVFLSIIVWTHTISAFITLVSMFALVVGYILYGIIYNRSTSSLQSRSVLMLLAPLIFLAIIIIYHWMDPSYPFFEGILRGLLRSLSQEARFLGTASTSVSNGLGRWEELLQPAGFSMYVFFGIIGTLYCLSKKELARKYLPLVVLVSVLFIVCYAFPIFGMQNIVPDRWPAFALVCFALFIGVGFLCVSSLLKKRTSILCIAVTFFFISSLLMITNTYTNHDSPLFGEEVYHKLVWTESEMEMYTHINSTYNGVISADEQTHQRPFKTYLKNLQSVSYRIQPNGTLDIKLLSGSLVIWRMDSLSRLVYVIDNQQRLGRTLLGDQFREYLNNNYNCVSDAHSARGYLLTIGSD